MPRLSSLHRVVATNQRTKSSLHLNLARRRDASYHPGASPQHLISTCCIVASTQRAASSPCIAVLFQPSASRRISSAHRHSASSQLVASHRHLNSVRHIFASHHHFVSAQRIAAVPYFNSPHRIIATTQRAASQLTALHPLISARCVVSPCLSLACHSPCSVHHRLHVWLILSLPTISLPNHRLILSLAAFNSPHSACQRSPCSACHHSPCSARHHSPH